MGEKLKKLLSISSPPIGPKLDGNSHVASHSKLKNEVLGILDEKNGFYAFESALLFRPLANVETPISQDVWNDPKTWLDTYKVSRPGLYFFAEDIFGGQFAILDETIVSFDPETGELEKISETLEGWAETILSDYEFYTGYPLAAQWQKVHGALQVGFRLVPRQLFVLGGEFDINNLVAVPEIKGMRSRGFFASELANVPDGTKVSFRLVD